MSREELYGLTTDMDRLVGAGASTAVASDKLRDRGKVVAELAKKVPGLVPLAQGIDKLRASSGKASASALLDLLVMTQTLRRSLTNIGVTGDLEKNARPGSWKTPLSTRQFRAMYDAVAGSGSDRHETIERAVKEGTLLDLRLVSPMLEEAQSGSSPVWSVLAESAIPAFGKDILPEIEAKLDIKGKSIASRLLPVVCKIDPVRGRELCLAALESGSIEMKVEALECLPKVEKPGEAEAWGMKMAGEKGINLRTAAMRSLCNAKSEEAFETLADLLKEENYEIWETAQESLYTMTYPKATAKLIERLKQSITEAERLEAELAEAKKAKKADAKKKPAPAKGKKAVKAANPVEAATEKLDNAYQHTSLLMNTIAGRTDEAKREAADVLLSMMNWKAFSDKEVIIQALAKVDPKRREVKDLLESMLNDKSFPKVSGALSAFQAMTPKDRSPFVPKILAVLDRPKVPEWIRDDALNGLDENFAEHKKLIVQKLREVLANKKPIPAQDTALDLISNVGTPAKELLPDVLDYLVRGIDFYYDMESILLALDPTGKTSIPKLIEALSSKSTHAKMMAADCLGKYGKLAASAVPELEKRLKDKDWAVRYHIEAALKEIQ